MQAYASKALARAHTHTHLLAVAIIKSGKNSRTEDLSGFSMLANRVSTSNLVLGAGLVHFAVRLGCNDKLDLYPTGSQHHGKGHKICLC